MMEQNHPILRSCPSRQAVTFRETVIKDRDAELSALGAGLGAVRCPPSKGQVQKAFREQSGHLQNPLNLMQL